MIPIDIGKLKSIAGEENVLREAADLYVYGSDSSVHEGMPQVIVRPENTGKVQATLRYANRKKIPVIARGSGSGMCGQVVPVQGGIKKLFDPNNILNPGKLMDGPGDWVEETQLRYQSS